MRASMHKTRIAGAVVVVVIATGVLWYALRGSPPAAPRVATAHTSTSSSASNAPAPPRSAAVVKPRKLTPEAREKRDEMRRKIYAAFAEAPPPTAPGAAPSATAAAPATNAAPGIPPGKPKARLEKGYIQKRIREDFFPLARECYEAALERDPALGGKLDLHFEIVGDESVGGIVELVERAEDNEIVEEEFIYRVRESMLSMTFEPPKGGGSVTVTYPFLFSNEDESGD